MRETKLIRRKNSSGKQILDLWEAYAELAAAAVVVIEDGYVGKNMRTALVLGEERGAIKAIAASGKAEVIALQPSAWRKHVITGWNANMGRGQTKTLVRATARWLATPRAPRGSVWDDICYPGLDKRSEDEMEAVLIGLAWNIKGASPKPKTKRRRKS